MTKHLVKKFQAIQSYVLDTHLNILSEYLRMQESVNGAWVADRC